MQRRVFLALAVATPFALTTPVAATDPGTLATGAFRDGDPVHRGSGMLRIFSGKTESDLRQLAMLDMNIVSGPNLLVYLVREPDPLFPEDITAGFYDLGSLQSLTGDQTYDIPTDVTLSDWGSVVVWCDTFKTPFAIATIERP